MIGKVVFVYWWISIVVVVGIVVLVIGIILFKNFVFFFIVGVLVCFVVLWVEVFGFV